jgi:hypothetical protein
LDSTFGQILARVSEKSRPADRTCSGEAEVSALTVDRQ